MWMSLLLSGGQINCISCLFLNTLSWIHKNIENWTSLTRGHVAGRWWHGSAGSFKSATKKPWCCVGWKVVLLPVVQILFVASICFGREWRKHDNYLHKTSLSINTKYWKDLKQPFPNSRMPRPTSKSGNPLRPTQPLNKMKKFPQKRFQKQNNSIWTWADDNKVHINNRSTCTKIC